MVIRALLKDTSVITRIWTHTTYIQLNIYKAPLHQDQSAENTHRAAHAENNALQLPAKQLWAGCQSQTVSTIQLRLEVSQINNNNNENNNQNIIISIVVKTSETETFAVRDRDQDWDTKKRSWDSLKTYNTDNNYSVKQES